MSRLGRAFSSVVQPRRRSYSIFSSRSGNGRYFNSSKPAKVITSTTKSGPSSGSSASSTAPSEPVEKLADDGQTPIREQVASEAPHSFATSTSNTVKDAPASNASTPRPAVPLMDTPPYLTLKPNDLMLHRFFALHRPCLLLNQPTNALFESAQPAPSSNTPSSPSGTIDDPPVASPEADSDAARQLSRSLVMSKVGNLVDWEHALARLGLSDAKTLDEPAPVGVSMDSVKRKRRKKMKKHKYVSYNFE